MERDVTLVEKAYLQGCMANVLTRLSCLGLDVSDYLAEACTRKDWDMQDKVIKNIIVLLQMNVRLEPSWNGLSH